MIYNSGVRSRAGRVGNTKKTNQDNYVINHSFFGHGDSAFFTVVDGHGTDGHKVSHFLKINLGSKQTG